VALIAIAQSFWTASHRATSRVRTAQYASTPAPCSCANTRASDTRSRLFRTGTCGARGPTPASTIARAITGTWSGPRFFGLRAGVNRREDIEGEEALTHGGIADAGRLHRRGGRVSARAGSATMKPTERKVLSLRDLHAQIDRHCCTCRATAAPQIPTA
jgi:hypothetical protein